MIQIQRICIRRPIWIFEMKVKITCPKCKSENVKVTSDATSPIPLYLCNKCGYKNKLFPQFGKKEEEEETRPSDAELEKTRRSDAMLEED